MPRIKTKTDDEILDALGRVLLRLGPHAFTLTDVGTETGLSPAALLQRFNSKRGLLVAFARRAAQGAAVPFDAAFEDGASPLAAVWRGLGMMSAEVADPLAFVHGMELLLEDIKDDELRKAAGEHARLAEKAIERLLGAAVAAGELASEDVASLARVVYAAWNGALIQWALRGQGPLIECVEETLRPLLGPPPD